MTIIVRATLTNGPNTVNDPDYLGVIALPLSGKYYAIWCERASAPNWLAAKFRSRLAGRGCDFSRTSSVIARSFPQRVINRASAASVTVPRFFDGETFAARDFESPRRVACIITFGLATNIFANRFCSAQRQFANFIGATVCLDAAHFARFWNRSASGACLPFRFCMWHTVPFSLCRLHASMCL
jgi:hypothetical protein